MKYEVKIPNWQNYFIVSKKTNPKYWLWKDRDKLPIKYKKLLYPKPLLKGTKEYCIDSNYNRFIKNTKSVGKENKISLNGQILYNDKADWRLRAKIVNYFHEYFTYYIKSQLKPIKIPDNCYLSISCDIYEINKGNLPDISNMWILEKLFEDSLTINKIIPDDGPKYVIESGRKKYHWVTEEKDRALIFTIEII